MPTPGARRARQDREAPEGSLDAPKRSRTISKPERPVPLLGRRSCPDQRFLPLHDRGALTRTKSCSMWTRDRITIWGQFFMTNRAARRHRHPGRERPRGAGLGPPSRSSSGVAHAPSPAPPLRFGHEGAAQYAALAERHSTRQHLATQAVAALGCGNSHFKAFAHRCDRTLARRPIALWRCVPLIGPLRRASDGLRRRRPGERDVTGDRSRGSSPRPAAAVNCIVESGHRASRAPGRYPASTSGPGS
jgi:hypothetical protein